MFTLQKKTVNECCRQVGPTCFALTKFCRPYQKSKKPRQKIGEPLGLADFLSGNYIALFCLFSVTNSISTFHTPLTRDQKCAKLQSTSVQRAWTEKILLTFRTKISIFKQFQGAAGIGLDMSLLTDEQEQRGSSFNYSGLPNFSKPDQKQRTKFKVYFP